MLPRDRRRLLILVLAAAAHGALAQAPGPRLPAPPPPSALELELAEGKTLIRAIRVEGARSIPEGAIREAVAPYEGRALGTGDFRDLERKLTQLYADRGFVTSGVVMRGRANAEGVAVFDAVEGTVSQVRFATPPRVANPAWLTGLLIPDPQAPVRLGDVQERMAALRDAGVVERIDARIEPLPRLGESELLLAVEEPRPWWAALQYDNYHSPVVGARRPSIAIGHTNITGWGDALDAKIGDTEGLEDARVSYSIPFLRSRWRAGARFERSDSLAIDPPSFKSLEIKSVSETRAVDLQFQFRTPASRALATGAAFERRTAETTLLGLPFSFIPGLPDGTTRVDVTRVFAVASARGDDEVAYLRVQASFGSVGDVLPDVEGAPDDRFSSYLVQGQYARQLTDWGLQAVARVEAQHTRDVLTPIERFVLGGVQTVRGYRESLILRDRALFGSVELRAPVWRPSDEVRVDLAAFVDAAWSRNTRPLAGEPYPERISSVGMGLAVDLPAGISARLDYAYPKHRWLTDNQDSQDRGLHFQLTWKFSSVIP